MQLQPFLQLLLAALLGGVIGLEREYRRKEAGLKTFSLVSIGTCLFTIIGFNLNELVSYPQFQLDPTRVIQAVAIGVGFIGAGLIIYRKFQVEGLTTAAGLWVAAAIGIAIGAQLYFLAIFATFLALGVLAGLRLIEEKFLPKPSESESEYER